MGREDRKFRHVEAALSLDSHGLRARDGARLNGSWSAFCRVETTAFGNGSSTPDLMAVRIAVTAADGNEAARVVRIGANDEEAVDTLVERLEAALGDTDRRELRLAAIARVLTASIPQEQAIG